MDEVETRQYCALVKVWVWAEDAKLAERVAVNSMNYLCGVDSLNATRRSDAPVAGFAVVEINEDGEV